MSRAPRNRASDSIALRTESVESRDRDEGGAAGWGGSPALISALRWRSSGDVPRHPPRAGGLSRQDLESPWSPRWTALTGRLPDPSADSPPHAAGALPRQGWHAGLCLDLRSFPPGECDDFESDLMDLTSMPPYLSEMKTRSVRPTSRSRRCTYARDGARSSCCLRQPYGVRPCGL